MHVQNSKTEIFQAGKKNITNQKILYNLDI